LLVALLCPPATAWGSSGGGGLGSPGYTGVQAGNDIVSASGDGVTIEARASAFLRNQLWFTGTAPARDAGGIVEIQRLGHQTGWRWTNTAHSTVARDGSFSVVWNANHIGRFGIRAVIASRTSVRARAAVASPAVTVTVYRPSIATQYGPGFWGKRTACGLALRKQTLGVANRTLRCGTPVALYYRGRAIVVPVIDRGPYANGADWDLTEATGQALGIAGTAWIGAVSLPPPPPR
jgi:hypothetical protein